MEKPYRYISIHTRAHSWTHIQFYRKWGMLYKEFGNILFSLNRSQVSFYFSKYSYTQSFFNGCIMFHWWGCVIIYLTNLSLKEIFFNFDCYDSTDTNTVYIYMCYYESFFTNLIMKNSSCPFISTFWSIYKKKTLKQLRKWS